jgi:hypothetical protein
LKTLILVEGVGGVEGVEGVEGNIQLKWLRGLKMASIHINSLGFKPQAIEF